MPRYFFHIEGDAPDTDGTEIADLATAKCEAVNFVGALLCDNSEDFWDTRELSLTVTNADGLTLFTLMFVGIEAAAISPARL